MAGSRNIPAFENRRRTLLPSFLHQSQSQDEATVYLAFDALMVRRREAFECRVGIVVSAAGVRLLERARGVAALRVIVLRAVGLEIHGASVSQVRGCLLSTSRGEANSKQQKCDTRYLCDLPSPKHRGIGSGPSHPPCYGPCLGERWH